MSELRLVLQEGLAEIKVKKSTFIGFLAASSTQEEALEIIAKVKKQHYNATHNCSAYIVEDGRIEHQNDDGEPSGTAGKPMLEVLRGAGLVNCVAVVTRYFGGVLLGTGGLVRAYTQAVQEAISSSRTAVKRSGYFCGIGISYTYVGKIKHQISERGIYMIGEDYGAGVELKLLMPFDKKMKVIQDITDITSADYSLLFEEDVNYILVDDKVKIL